MKLESAKDYGAMSAIGASVIFDEQWNGFRAASATTSGLRRATR